MDNPYQDVMESSKSKPNSIAKRKQFFAHTDNNLKGISNLVKDEDLIVGKIENQKWKQAVHNFSSSNEDTNMSSYYFYPQKFAKQGQAKFGDLGEL